MGFDINPQPNYPFRFVRMDALKVDLSGFHAIHASPPCQFYIWATRKDRTSKYPDLVGKTREYLLQSGKPYVIENNPGAPLRDPIMLCGQMFGLGVIRHRLFESSISLEVPPHPKCSGKIASGECITVAGHGGDSKRFSLKDCQDAMRIFHMTKAEMTQAIPPAYTAWIGRQLIQYLTL